MFTNTHASGSYGVKIQAGSSSSNYSLAIADKDNSTTHFYFQGDGRLGIGTTSPASWSKLHVAAAAGGDQTGASQILNLHAPTTTAGHGVGLRMSAASGSKEAVGIIGMVNNASGNSGSMTFHTYNAGATIPEVMRIDNTGKVGIGTSSPSANLTITDENAGQATIQARNFATSATGSFGNQHAFEFRAATSTTTHGMLVALQENDITRRAFEVAGSGGIFLSAVSCGRVGIGTQSPAGPLHIKSSGNTIQYIDAGTNGSASLRLLNDAQHWDVNLQTNDNFAIYDQTGGNQAFTIAPSTMYAGFGPGGGGANSPSAILGVVGNNSNTAADGAFYVASGGSSDWSQIIYEPSEYGLNIRSGSSTSYMIYMSDASSNAARFRVNGMGVIFSSNTTVQSISDRRLKENIVDANSQWNDIKSLKWRNYSWKDNLHGEGTYLGLIADEVKSISPNLVEIDAQPKEDVEAGIEDPQYETVKYSIVWMKAMKALQEAMERIETLEAEVAALKGE